MSTESEMRAILQELHDKFNTRVYGTSSYIKRDMRDRIEAVLAASPPAPAGEQPVYESIRDAASAVYEATVRPAPAGEGAEPVAWRTRYRSEPGMIGHYPWTYTEGIRGMRLDHYEYEPLFAHPPRESADAERLRHAGAMLSNCAFNLAQRKPGEPLTEADIRALDESRKAWDAARTSEGGNGK
jgi:hypothetical protein